MKNLNDAIKAKKSKEAIKLIESGCDLETIDESGLYPLHLSVLYGLTDVAVSLLDKGVDPNVVIQKEPESLPENNSLGPMVIDEPILKKILTNIHNLGYYTPLHIAVKENNLKIGKLLLLYRADPDVVDFGKCTPLHWAALQGKVDFVRLLLQFDAEPNALDLALSTPLHEAVRRQHKDVIEELLSSNANPNLKDVGDLSSFDYAKGSSDIYDMLVMLSKHVPEIATKH